MTSIRLSANTPLANWLAAIEACHPAEIELGLDRMRQVAQRLPINLDQSIKVIVGGTNGKGTSVKLLETILLEAGYTVGTYTSPHFIRYNERVSLSGEPVEDAQLCQAFAQIEAHRQDVTLTYFEYGTLAALIIFAQTKPDVLLLEVGLGGRLDSVNLVDADIALISTIALDHTEWLGPDRESIGFEKAGIFRARSPAVCGDPDAPKSLIGHAQSINATLFRNGIDYQYERLSDDTWSWEGKNGSGEKVCFADLPLPRLPLQNAAAVLQVLQLMPVNVSREQLGLGLSKAQLTGRMQAASHAGFPCVLDVAHNPESAAYLAHALSTQPSRTTHLVLGMLADKDMFEVCQHLLPIVDYWHLVTLDTPRSATAAQLRGILNTLGVSSSSVAEYPHVRAALSALPDLMESDSRVVIAGSFYTVTDALQIVESVNGK